MGDSTDGPRAAGITRRGALRLVGFGAATAAVAASGLLTGSSAWALQKGGAQPSRVTVDGWAANRGPRYFIAHRGSGDVLPEHSMQAYRAAVGWGAECLEISVGMTSDGVLICLHDLTYDRTTSATGPVHGQPSAVLSGVRILQPRLGEAWLRNPPGVPLFEDVLRAFGGRVVLAVEAKLSAAYAPMMAMVERYGLRDSVIVKAHFTSKHWPEAKRAGYSVFCYLGSAREATRRAIAATASRLDADRDYLVVPGQGAAASAIDAIIKAAVATGIPVWVFPLHRRSEADRAFSLGARGGICSSFGYISGSIPPATEDSWAAQAISAGEMTRNPSIDRYAPSFGADGQLILAAQGIQHFVALGQLGPLPNDQCRITVDTCWQELPASLDDNVTLAFGRSDDSYYEHSLGRGDGFHAVLRANGALALYRHRDGQVNGELLAPAVATPPPRPGQWAALTVDISATGITVSRTDAGATIRVANHDLHRGYVHLGRSSTDGRAAFRTLRIS